MRESSKKNGIFVPKNVEKYLTCDYFVSKHTCGGKIERKKKKAQISTHGWLNSTFFVSLSEPYCFYYLII